MTPVRFIEQNATIAKDQPEYLPLPACIESDDAGVVSVTSCWGLTWLERLTLLLTGRVWLRVLTFGHPLQPVLLMAQRPIMYL